MLGTPFSHDMIRKYIVAFGTLFNNVKLQRIGDTDTTWISVPLTFASKEKWYARLTNPNLTRQVQAVLPRMSYEMVTVNYDPDRKLNTLNRVGGLPTGDNIQTMYEAVPYDISFSLQIYSRNAADASNILEQIVPFFTPEFTMTINDATSLNVDVDIPIVLNSVGREDAYDGDFDSHRTIIWTLDFTMKAKLFGPVTQGKLIKKAYVDFFIPGSTVAYHNGTVAKIGADETELYLQANTASRSNTAYQNAKVYVYDPGPPFIQHARRTITKYDGNSQLATLDSGIGEAPDVDWQYSIEFLVPYSRTIPTDTSGLKLAAGFANGDSANTTQGGTPTVSRIYTTPGLTADGDPTTNSFYSVAINTIDAEDDFGFIQTYTFFPSNTTISGTRRNLATGIDE